METRIFNYVKRIMAKNDEKRRLYEYDKKKLHHLSLPQLTSEEFKILKKTWPCFKFSEKDILWARVYKKELGFDPFFVSSGYQSVIIKRVLNPKNQICSLENKALVDVYLPDIPFPKTYIRCINQILYDNDLKKISFEDAVSILKEKKTFVIKPALDSMQGQGVKKIDLLDVENTSNEWFKDLFHKASKNFIVQEVVLQHPDIEKLNPSSLNCCRITTILINGKYTYAAMLKIGKNGSRVDNWSSSYLVGINNEGILNGVGYGYNLNTVNKTDNGIQFGDMKYPCFDALVSNAESFHKKYFPQCGIVGWDVLIDKENQPVVIEANLSAPGVVAEQLCSGPFFKEVHQEVVNCIKQTGIW